MSPKVLIGTALLAAVVIGFAWFTTGGYTLQTDTPTSTSSTTTTTSTPPASASSYTLAEVATHNNPSSCWRAINGKVYNLTSWINQHPGGPEHILSICGIDGSSAFNAQHGGQSRPESELARFYIGTLSQ